MTERRNQETDKSGFLLKLGFILKVLRWMPILLLMGHPWFTGNIYDSMYHGQIFRCQNR
jgi:hypothetical protein